MTDATAILSIDKPSFVRRWLSDFLLERHSGAARTILLVISLAFFLFGPMLVLWLASFLPVSELGSSGASLFLHHLLQALAAALAGSLLILCLRPNPGCLELTDAGIRMKWRLWLFPFKSFFMPWKEIGTICIERPSGKTDMRMFRLCLYSSQDTHQSIKIPLGNLRNDDDKEKLALAVQTKATKAIIEPGTLESIRPARNLSFTDIWLDALAAAPGRERLTPLLQETTLNNRFKITRRLGGGGQATAYLAFDQDQSSQVVLKETILPVYADLHTRKQSLEKFHQEAIALESVKHPQIVRYLDSFVEDHRAYLVLQYIEGTTLRRYINGRGPASQPDAIRMGLQMCEILSALHDLSTPLIHRDFTPDNLMINEEGKLVLIDFAVAVASQESSEEAAGKVAYMAPEQFKGSSTAQSDIYSCGCSLHYVLTGIDPVALSKCHPQKLNPSVGAGLDAIIARSTSQTREERYQNIHELHAALKELSM